MSSTGKEADAKVFLGGIEFTRKDEDEDAQIEFMARRLGYNRFVFIGYHYENCLKWANSYGAVGDGRIRIAAKCVDTIGAMGLAIVLMENDRLRRDVFDILNRHFTSEEMKDKCDGRQCPKGD